MNYLLCLFCHHRMHVRAMPHEFTGKFNASYGCNAACDAKDDGLSFERM
jgi:hypothetical protein